MSFRASLLAWLTVLLVLAGVFTGVAAQVLAGPVEWHEVPTTNEGRQWWDSGSLRLSRGGNVSVLTRFQAAASEEQSRQASDLYVMEIDCGQELFRDTSVNGLPKFGSQWQPSSGDNLITSVINEVCAVSSEKLA